MSTSDGTGARRPNKPLRPESGQELDEIITESDTALVEFYTKGCTLCQSIEPVLGNVARASEVTVAMFNPQRDLEFVEAYDIRSVPTLLLFKDGEVVGRLAEGFQGTDAVLSFIEAHTDAALRA